MKSEEILESIRELLYDVEHARNDNEINDLVDNYLERYPETFQSTWKNIDPQFKPAIKVKELLHQWAKRG